MRFGLQLHVSQVLMRSRCIFRTQIIMKWDKKHTHWQTSGLFGTLLVHPFGFQNEKHSNVPLFISALTIKSFEIRINQKWINKSLCAYIFQLIAGKKKRSTFLRMQTVLLWLKWSFSIDLFERCSFALQSIE